MDCINLTDSIVSGVYADINANVPTFEEIINFQNGEVTSLGSDYASNLLNVSTKDGVNFYSKYDKTLVDRSASLVNTIVRNITNSDQGISGTVYADLNINEFPTLSSRVNQRDFDGLDIALFLENSGYTQETFIRDITSTPRSPLLQIEHFLNDNAYTAISGGFCSAFGNVFAKITSLVALGSSIADSINKLKNIDSNLIKASLIAANEKVKDLIDNIVDKMKDRAEQVLDKAKSFVNDVSFLIEGTVEKITKSFANIQNMFSKDNIEKTKEKFENLFSSMAGQFEKVTPEVLSFLMFRICQFMETLQKVFQSPIDSFSSLVNKISDVKIAYESSYLSEINNRMALSSISELSSSDVANVRNNAKVNLNSSKGNRSQVNNIETSDTKAVIKGATNEIMILANTWNVEQNSDGSFSSVSNKWIKLQPQVINMGRNFSDSNPRDGWEKVNQKVWTLVYMLGERLGTQLTINSAYRSPLKNASVGGAKSSFHMKGLAVDITYAGVVDPIEMIKHASILGSGGIGFYKSSGFIHIDLGSARTWATQGTTTNVDTALQLHKSSNANGPYFVDDYTPTEEENKSMPTIDLIAMANNAINSITSAQ